MFAYHLRIRHLKFQSDEPPEFPAPCTIRCTLVPEDVFGGQVGDSPVLTKDTEGHILFDANSGRYFGRSARPFGRVSVEYTYEGIEMHVSGNMLSCTFECTSIAHLSHLVGHLYLILPQALSLHLRMPVRIASLEGELGSERWRAEIPPEHFRSEFQVVTQEFQEQRVSAGLGLFGAMSAAPSPRLIAALNYYYIASRLRSVGESQSEFCAEVCLNLAKTLEALFGPCHDDQRQQLRLLGYGDEEIESRFVGVLKMRNELDVAHCTLTPPTIEERRTVELYLTEAFTHFGELLRRAESALAAGTLELPEHDAATDRSRSRVVRRLEAHNATLASALPGREIVKSPADLRPLGEGGRDMPGA